MQTDKTILRTIIFLMGLLIISCGNSDQQKAQGFLNRAQLLYNQQHYNQAKLALDSINVLFPQMIPMRQKADTVMYRIELQEAIRDLHFADSTLTTTQHLADSLAHPFLFTKNTKYDEIGQYTLKSQQSPFYATHTFLKPIIDENGTLTIMSVYCGSPIGHTTVRASANGVFAETNPASKASCFSYSNQGKSWENVNFTGKDISGLVSFIASNLKTSVEISLEGGRRVVRYVIPQADKEGILQAYYLSEALKEVRQLKLNVLQSKQTIVITCGHLHLDPAGYIPIKTVVDKK